VTRSASPKLAAYGALAGFGLLGALVARRPEIAVASAPFLLVLALALASVHEPELRVDVEPGRERAVEGDEVELTVTVRSEAPVESVELLVALPAGLAAVPETPNPVAFGLRTGEREHTLRVRCDRWGGYVLGDVHVRARDRFGVFRFEGRWKQRLPLKVYPREETLQVALRPRETQVFAGNEVARQKAEGIEFADLRPFSYGDRMRRINWRASARRGELWVNEHHAERNTDVVLFLDTFVEARRLDASTLDGAVRAAASLSSEYLRQRDRVGLVSFGGLLRWFLPGSGLIQRYRIIDALLDTEVIENYAWKDIDVIPPRTLPPQALVVALTPLLDPRAVNALLDLRARGFDLAVVEISPVPFSTVGPAGELDVLAHRLWQMSRESLRARFHRAGVSVIEWTEGVPLAAALEEAASFRRFARLARG
jgi:uncharacterized protein (DUF58 family)